MSMWRLGKNDNLETLELVDITKTTRSNFATIATCHPPGRPETIESMKVTTIDKVKGLKPLHHAESRTLATLRNAILRVVLRREEHFSAAKRRT